MSGENLKVAVRMKDRRRGSNGGGADEAVDELPYGLAATAARTVKSGGLLVIGRFGRDEGSSSEQAAKIAEVSFVACSGQHLHSNWVAGGDLVVQELVDPGTDGAAGITEELDPCRGVDEDHVVRLVRISSRSPFHPEPRS